jgi:hypothetical protein
MSTLTLCTTTMHGSLTPMSTKHTATLPDGQIVTRTSKGRVYSHAVAIQKPAALLRSEHEQALVYNINRYLPRLEADLARLVAGETKDHEGRVFHLKGENETFVSYPTRDEQIEHFHGYIASCKETIAKLQAALAADEFADGEWGCAGWQSRPDLAEKEAARWLKNGWRAVILDNVEQTVKAAKATKKGS